MIQPLTRPPEHGEKYFWPDPSFLDGTCWAIWSGDTQDRVLLERGMIHDNEEDAQRHGALMWNPYRREKQ